MSTLTRYQLCLLLADFTKMALRILGRQYLGCLGLRPVFVSQCRSVSIQPRPADIPIEEGHDERNMRLCRPQSPHMTIFKWQLPAILSITHRFTGIILTGYTATFAAVSLLSSKPMGEIINNISQCYPTFFLLYKMGLLFPFSYHFFNGMRHLVWDTGCCLTLKGVYVTGYIMLLVSILSFGGLIYYLEETKKQELLEKLKKQQEEEEAKAKALAAEEELKNKKGKKKK